MSEYKRQKTFTLCHIHSTRVYTYAIYLINCIKIHVPEIVNYISPSCVSDTFQIMSILEKLVTAAGLELPPAFVYGKYGNIMDRFMTLGTCGPCVELGDHISICMEFSFINNKPMSHVGENSLLTWVPQDRVPIILVALGNSCTAVCIVETKKIYYASNVISLPGDVPAGSILLAHYTEDLIGSYREPRVLVYDVVCWGVTLDVMKVDNLCSNRSNRYQYRNMQNVSASDRYSLLRDDFDDLLKADDVRNLLNASPDAPPRSRTIVLQWVGFASAASQFLHGGINVGHCVSTLLQLSDQNALNPEILDCSR
jgi:hypothetical protein